MTDQTAAERVAQAKARAGVARARIAKSFPPAHQPKRTRR